MTSGFTSFSRQTTQGLVAGFSLPEMTFWSAAISPQELKVFRKLRKSQLVKCGRYYLSLTVVQKLNFNSKIIFAIFRVFAKQNVRMTKI